MKVLSLAVIVAVLAVTAARRPTRYAYRDDYDYDYDNYRRPRPMYYDDHREDRHHDSREDSHEEVEEDKDEVDDHIYRFAISEDDLGPYMYHDEGGHAQGFEIDLMNAVCEHAHKKCFALLDKTTHCWYWEEGHEYPGMGLMASWFDGCVGFFPTVERKNSFDFTHSFTENMKVGLYYKKDAGLMEADDHELANHKIGFVKGWPTSQACLDHQQGYHGNHIGEYTSVLFDDAKHLVDAVMNGEVDAILAPKAMALEKKGLVHTEPWMQCTTDGAAVMLSHGSPVANWWDKAYDEMKDSGEFRELCRRAERVHGHKGQLFCN